jgi:hypothetical protein
MFSIEVAMLCLLFRTRRRRGVFNALILLISEPVRAVIPANYLSINFQEAPLKLDVSSRQTSIQKLFPVSPTYRNSRLNGHTYVIHLLFFYKT